MFVREDVGRATYQGLEGLRSAWLDWLEVECGANPVLLVLEDMHWGDAPSVQLVDAALRTLRDRPLMVLAFGPTATCSGSRWRR